MSPQLQLVLNALRNQLRQIYGERLARLVLYGSQSRGEADAGSDIDVMVVLRGVVRPSREIARIGEVTASLSLEFGVVISCLFISAHRYAREKSPLLLNVRREGVAL